MAKKMTVKLLSFALLSAVPLSAAYAQSGAPANRTLATPAAVPSTPASRNAAVVTEDSYQIGPGDVIEVRVLGQQDFTTRARIREDGTIALPFLGDVQARGRNTSEFARDVSQALDRGGYYTKPIVNVEIASYASRYVTILGAVAQSGLQPVDREYRLSEILARAGGLRNDSSDEIIVRGQNGQETRALFSDIALGRTDSDPIVRPGDRIFAPVAESYYIYGQVNQPGAYPVKTDMTLRNALARGGGLTASGSQKRISIFRKGQKVKVSLEDKVQPGDTIVIGERLF